MLVSNFDFDLPPERIALRPAVPRHASKLLVVDHQFTDQIFRDLPQHLRAGDVIVFNDTKVIPAALTGKRVGRKDTEPKIEILLHMRLNATTWKAFAKPAKKLEQGDKLLFGELSAQVEHMGEQGEITLAFEQAGESLEQALQQWGRMPLPPYIAGKRPTDVQDQSDYQTMFAAKPGAVAAPTASLHFTPEVIAALKDKGIQFETVTLHVGAGTFLPVKADDTADHKMHAEWGDVSELTAQRLHNAKAEGRRIIAAGTTSARLLEASGLQPFTGTTDIFIIPGYTFRTIDGLITNFHLPRSTLFMLVCAFAGTERMRRVYAHAIANNYRFYSYGDASLLWPQA
jgi:S-adenosylmethionine:tRNA ribosyltransferase-isomerase